jgi:alpha-glucosidase
VEFVDGPESLLTMIRACEEETVTCLFNLGAEPVEIPESADLCGTVLSQTGSTIDLQARTMPPYTFVILRR